MSNLNSNLTEVVILLDSSTSMTHLKESTIRHFQEFIETQKKESGEVKVTVVTFDSEVKVHYDGAAIEDVNMVDKYVIQGMTALYDGIGVTFERVGKRLASMSEKDRPSKVIVVIITDGEENCSSDFTHAMVRNMIKVQREQFNWEILFIGANIVSESLARGLNIANSANYSTNESSNRSVYHTISQTVADYRNTGAVAKGWSKDIEE